MLALVSRFPNPTASKFPGAVFERHGENRGRWSAWSSPDAGRAGRVVRRWCPVEFRDVDTYSEARRPRCSRSDRGRSWGEPGIARLEHRQLWGHEFLAAALEEPSLSSGPSLSSPEPAEDATFPHCRPVDPGERPETRHSCRRGNSISGAFRLIVVVRIPVDGIEEV